MGEVDKKPLTESRKLYKLEIKQEAIVCPACRQKIRGVRLLPGAVLRNVSVMCQRCHTISVVNIDPASAAYSPRH